MMHRSEKLEKFLGSGDQEYFYGKRPVNLRVEGIDGTAMPRRTLPADPASTVSARRFLPGTWDTSRQSLIIGPISDTSRFELTTLRLTVGMVKNLSAASGVAYKNIEAILSSLAAANPAPKKVFANR